MLLGSPPAEGSQAGQVEEVVRAAAAAEASANPGGGGAWNSEAWTTPDLCELGQGAWIFILTREAGVPFGEALLFS